MDTAVPDRFRRWRRDRVGLAVVAIALLTLVTRLVQLGYRTAQYDEAWVGYWVLRYAATGAWEYRPLVHGPFFPQINRWVFTTFGATDFTARFVVAVLGGLFPLVALLFRDRLRSSAVVALSGLFAATPLLVYYSRFMRFDVPLAFFMLAAIGFGLQAVDRSEPRYLYPAAASFGLGLTTKESWVLYLVAWAGAALVVLDTYVLTGEAGLVATVRSGVGRFVRTLDAWAGSVALSVLTFLVVVIYFYAPRAGSTAGPGLWKAFTTPAMFPAVLGEATLGSLTKLYDQWVGSGLQDHPYLPYLQDYLATIWEGALVVAVFAVVGFVVDRHVRDRPRHLVGFAFFWGLANVAGYPLANFLQTPWSTIHAVVPLAIPAAVGLGWVYERGRTAWEDDQLPRAVAAVLVLVACSGLMAATAIDTAYLNPQNGDSEIVYLSQPEGNIGAEVAALRAVAPANDGVDVLYYGEFYNLTDESIGDRPPGHSGWHSRLPVAWYVEGAGASHDSVTSLDRWEGPVPPVIVARDNHRDTLAARLDGYRVQTCNLSQINRETVFFVRENATASG